MIESDKIAKNINLLNLPQTNITFSTCNLYENKDLLIYGKNWPRP